MWFHVRLERVAPSVAFLSGITESSQSFTFGGCKALLKRENPMQASHLAEPGQRGDLNWRYTSNLRTLGGTPNRDPCNLLGLIWRVPRDIGVI